MNTLRKDQTPAGPYMEKHFLGAISSFKTLEPLGDDNWVASWKGQNWPTLELNEVPMLG